MYKRQDEELLAKLKAYSQELKEQVEAKEDVYKRQEEYLAVVERLADQPIDMMEINISCPNVNAGFLAFGQDAHHVEELTAQIKKIAKQPVIMKLKMCIRDRNLRRQ